MFRNASHLVGEVLKFYDVIHLCFTVSFFLELAEYIFKIPGVETFLSERLSQDTLEQLFGCQRQRGKSHENPNMEQFCKGTQAFRVINGTCGSVKRGNCKGNNTTIDWEKENCPLPKRKRSKAKKATSKLPNLEHASNQVIKAPSQVIKVPSQVMETPSQVIKAPSQVIKAPGQVMEAPQSSHQSPQSNHQSPQSSHQSPQSSHQSPQ